MQKKKSAEFGNEVIWEKGEILWSTAAVNQTKEPFGYWLLSKMKSSYCALIFFTQLIFLLVVIVIIGNDLQT